MSEHVSAPAGKRILAAIVDFLDVPVLLGVIIGILFVMTGDLIPKPVQGVILILSNWVWLTLRDVGYSVGRLYIGRKIASIVGIVVSALVLIFSLPSFGNPDTVPQGVFAFLGGSAFLALNILVLTLNKPGNLKLVSLVSDSVSVLQAFLRNIFLVLPGVLLSGYICEFLRVCVTNNLLIRRVLYAVVLALSLIFGGMALAENLARTEVGVLDKVISALLFLGATLTPILFLIKDKDATTNRMRLMDTMIRTQVVEA